MARPTLGSVAALVFALVLARPSGAEPIRPPTTGAADSGGSAHVVNGLLTPLYPTVGALLLGGEPETARAWCSGTLIGCESFLTAAHCVCGSTGAACQDGGAADPSGYLVFLQHAGIFRVARIVVHPDYRFPRADLALVTLASPVTGLAPTPLNAVGAPPDGTPGTIVGFGRSGGDRHDYGLKRLGRVSTEIPDDSDGLISWRFNEPFGPPGSNSNTCSGDSGGPLFVDLGAGEVLAGVTSGGYNGTCLAEDLSFDTDVSAYRGWIEDQLGADRDRATCGDLAEVGTPGTGVFAFSGELTSTVARETHWVEVPSRTRLLRVTLNGIDGVANFDLSVRAGNAASPSDADCRQAGSGQYGVCTFDAPAPGTWQVVVDRIWGAGAYQLTVTTFEAGEGSSRCGTASPVECKTPSAPRNGFLLLRDATPDRGDRLAWKWTNGAATSKEEFGNPAAGTELVVCAYHHGTGGTQLIMEQVVPTGAGWREFRRGFGYSRRAAKGGIDRVMLKAGANGRAAIVVEGAGEALGLRSAGAAAAGRFGVQLRNDTACWEAEYRGGLGARGLLRARSE